MKYSSYKADKYKKYCLKTFSGGIDLNADPVVLSEDKLGECENLWMQNGVLTSRQGAAADERFFAEYEGSSDMTQSPIVTDTLVTFGAETYRIAYMMHISGSETSQYVNVYFVDKNGNFTNAGTMMNYRLDRYNFYVADNVFFIVGKAKFGCGVYAFMRIDNYGLDKDYAVYELSTDRTKWIRLWKGDFYSPIIYINGRGMRYEEADNPYTGTPMAFEDPNMLTGDFRAYYTSDGISASFQLPVLELDDSKITARVYRSPGDYIEWNIMPEESSGTTRFYGQDIVMTCNRKTGIVSFTVDGLEYAIPKMVYYNANNIKFSARKEVKENIAKIIGSQSSFAYNSRIYICGNQTAPNEVYSARSSNPLYFPTGSVAVIGDSSPVNAIGVQNNKLVAFKTDEICRINLSEGNLYSRKELFVGEGIEFYRSDNVSISSIHTAVGCDCPRTLRLCGNRLVWLNSNGTVYALATTAYGKENNVYEISLPIQKRLRQFSKKTLKKAFATEHQGKYLLFVDRTVFVMDYRVKAFGFSATYLDEQDVNRALAWYLWEMPDDMYITTAHSISKGIAAICQTKDMRLFYSVCFDGDKDIVMVYNDENTVEKKECPIKSRLTTGRMDFGCEERFKDLRFLCLCASSDNSIKLTLRGDQKTVTRQLRLPKTLDTVKLSAHLNGFGRVSMTIEGTGRFTIADTVFYYDTRVC